jgi:glycolate oxidase iron-sulfur subunit
LFNGEYDALVTNAAGCGSGVQEYVSLFLGDEEEESARRLAAKSMDVSVFLAELGLVAPPALPQPLKVAYHDACHLAHAQKVTQSPRDLLNAIPNLTLLPIEQNEICCGSAGMYQFEQPEISAQLGQIKAENILRTECEMVATGNIGCQVQIRHYLQKTGVSIPVIHTIELLDLAYQNG